MESLRAYTANNRGSIINVVYVVAVLVGLYYLYKWLVSGSDLEYVALDKEVDANVPQQFALPAGSNRLRVKRGGEYTLSFWMHINSWELNAGRPKGVVRILEAGDPSPLMAAVLYPNEPIMAVRVRQDTSIDLTTTGTNGVTSPMCDLADISLQRWIHVAVSVNGRIVDTYYDGKLARSCVLPKLPYASDSKAQTIEIGFAATTGSNGFAGKISGIEFFAYPLTPDRIYSLYQAGPAGPSGLLGYIKEKLGINIKYSA